jgi:hypothetical protein
MSQGDDVPESRKGFLEELVPSSWEINGTAGRREREKGQCE